MNPNLLEQYINNGNKHIAAFLCPFLITFFAIPIIVKISKEKELFDQPNGRTSHGELMAAFFLIVLGGFRFTYLHGFLGIYEINYLTSFIITLIIMIGIVNAMNLIDGIDGLAAGLAAILLLQNLNIHILALIVLAAGLLKGYIPTYIAERWLKRAPKAVVRIHRSES